jgi:hypothetical protein
MIHFLLQFAFAAALLLGPLLYGKFADAWRVSNTTSLFDYGPGLSTADFTDRNWPQENARNCTAPGSPRPSSRKVSPETARRLCRAIKDKSRLRRVRV